MRKWALLVLLALFLLPVTASAASTDVNNFTYDPVPAQAGKELTVWVNIKNTTNYIAENVSVEIIPKYPFSLLPGEKEIVEVGTLTPYQSSLLSFKLLVAPSAPKGTYELEFRMKDNTEGIRVKPINIIVSANNPRVELIKSSETSAFPGQELPLKLTVKNIGGQKAKNVVVKIKEDRTVTTTGIVVEREIVPLGASAALAQDLNPNEEAIVELLLGINKEAKLKNYPLTVTVEYYDENGTQFSSTGYIGLNVVSSPELDAVINSVSPLGFPGGTSEIGIDVFNIGAGSASYVVAELSMEGAEFSENKIFIGTLEPDDFDSFKTKAKIGDKITPGTYNLELKLSFKDENNKMQTIQKSLPIKIVSAGEAQAASGQAGNAVFGIIGLLLQLVGLFVVAKWLYNKLKKRFRK